jgi:hypothetical protein
MAAQYQMERDRGTKESCQQLAVLREKWPLAFPVKDQDVRPLAIGAVGEIAAAMGWSIPYTLGVLSTWKMAPVYCEAVLRHDQRIVLTVRRPNRSKHRQRTWRPSGSRSSRPARPRRKLQRPRRPPW